MCLLLSFAASMSEEKFLIPKSARFNALNEVISDRNFSCPIEVIFLIWEMTVPIPHLPIDIMLQFFKGRELEKNCYQSSSEVVLLQNDSIDSRDACRIINRLEKAYGLITATPYVDRSKLISISYKGNTVSVVRINISEFKEMDADEQRFFQNQVARTMRIPTLTDFCNRRVIDGELVHAQGVVEFDDAELDDDVEFDEYFTMEE